MLCLRPFAFAGFVSGPPLNHVDFVSPREAVEQLMRRTPGFWERMGPVNLAVRLLDVGRSTTADRQDPDALKLRYARQYAASLTAVPEEHRERIGRIVADLRRGLRSSGTSNTLGFDAETAAAMASMARDAVRRLRIVCSTGRGAEHGYAHTVGDVIVLPSTSLDRDLKTDADLGRLILHEAMHVFQRASWQRADAFVRSAYGFVTVERQTLKSSGDGEERANPDTAFVQHEYGLPFETKILRARPVFVPGAATLADIRLLPDAGYRPAFPWARNHEHPYEIMAEHAAATLDIGKTT